MSQVIRISDSLFKRLEAHASGFDTPSNVIENILNVYEGNDLDSTYESNSEHNTEIQPANSLDIIYSSNSEEEFKQELLISKMAFIKLHFTNGTTELKEWNASRFKKTSSVDGNLRSGYLRGWKGRGIFKAELAVNLNEIT